MFEPHLLFVGACYLDIILTVDHFPAEDEKLRATELVKRYGGNCINTLQVLNQLPKNPSIGPVHLALSSVLPAESSAAGQQFTSELSGHTDVTPCINREECDEAASSYIINSRASGSRTIVNYNELPEMTSQEFIGQVESRCGGMSWCHFEGRMPQVIIEVIPYLRQRFPSVAISVELEKPNREGLQELASQADVVFFSKSWAQCVVEGNGYSSAEACLRSQASLLKMPYLLCCTWGNEGAAALQTLGDVEYKYEPAFHMVDSEVIDTIGAGDTFIAGMLHGLISYNEEWDLTGKLNFANELAGRKVLQEGFSGLGAKMRLLS